MNLDKKQGGNVFYLNEEKFIDEGVANLVYFTAFIELSEQERRTLQQKIHLANLLLIERVSKSGESLINSFVTHISLNDNDFFNIDAFIVEREIFLESVKGEWLVNYSKKYYKKKIFSIELPILKSLRSEIKKFLDTKKNNNNHYNHYRQMPIPPMYRRGGIKRTKKKKYAKKRKTIHNR